MGRQGGAGQTDTKIQWIISVMAKPKIIPKFLQINKSTKLNPISDTRVLGGPPYAAAELGSVSPSSVEDLKESRRRNDSDRVQLRKNMRRLSRSAIAVLDLLVAASRLPEHGDGILCRARLSGTGR